MSDFVTRLESELRQAALRQKRAGWPHRVALPRLRAFGGLAATAVAILGTALVLAGVAAVFLGSEPERAAGRDVPAGLPGTWRLPTSVQRHVERPPADLRLYSGKSERCTQLGLGSLPCYAIDDAQGTALQWGTVSVAGDEITFRLRGHCVPNPCGAVRTPGVYLWRVQAGSLYLTKLRDRRDTRAATLDSGPLRRASEASRTKIPDGWTANRFRSERYGYSIRYPRHWSARAATSPMPQDRLASDTSDTTDKLSRAARGVAAPMVLIAASDIPQGTTFGHWSAQIQTRVAQTGACSKGGRTSASVAGEPAEISIYSYCNGNGRQQQWAAFVHGGRGYQVAWWGQPRRWDVDGPLFHKILKTFRFHN